MPDFKITRNNFVNDHLRVFDFYFILSEGLVFLFKDPYFLLQKAHLLYRFVR